MSNSYIPIDFYYNELFNYFSSFVGRYYRNQTGIGFGSGTYSYNTLRTIFINNLHKQNNGRGVSAEECLHTMLTIELARNASSRKNIAPHELKTAMLNKLTKRYCESRYAEPGINEYFVSENINDDFREVKRDPLEIQSDGVNPNSPVHSIQSLFFSSLETALDKDLAIKGKKKRLILKKSKDTLRYVDTAGKIKRLGTALGFTLVSGALALAMHANGRPSTTIPAAEAKTSTIETPTENLNEYELNIKTKQAVDLIYSDPAKIRNLGFSPIVEEKFVQYDSLLKQVKDGRELSSEEQESYDMLRKNIIDMIITMKLNSAVMQTYFQEPNFYDIATPAGGVTASVNFSLNGTSYTLDDTSLDGSHLALAKASEGLHDQKQNTPAANDTYLDGSDDLDRGVREAILFAMSDVEIDKDSGTITEKQSEENVLKVLQEQNKDEQER